MKNRRAYSDTLRSDPWQKEWERGCAETQTLRSHLCLTPSPMKPWNACPSCTLPGRERGRPHSKRTRMCKHSDMLFGWEVLGGHLVQRKEDSRGTRYCCRKANLKRRRQTACHLLRGAKPLTRVFRPWLTNTAGISSPGARRGQTGNFKDM